MSRATRTSKRAKAAKPAKKQPTRSQRRSSREARRTRLVLAGAVVVSVGILVAWFPASALVHQKAALAAQNSQLVQLRQEDTALNQEHKNLSDSAEVGRIAREQYQLVSPGQEAYEILPPASTAPANAPYAGDPGNSAPVAPSAASELPPGSVATTTQPAASGTPATGSVNHSTESSAGGLITRMLHSLEFWR